MLESKLRPFTQELLSTMHFVDPLLFFSLCRFKHEIYQLKDNLFLQFVIIHNKKIRIVHENTKSRSAQELVHNYLPVNQNLTSTKQLSRYSNLKNGWACLCKFQHTNRKGENICIIRNKQVVKEILYSFPKIMQSNWSIPFWSII